MESKHDVCVTLDKLIVEMLGLLEDRVQSQLNVENAMKDGSIHLAKSRYIMGQSAISKVQLPTENSPEFDSSVKLECNEINEEFLKFQQLSLLDSENQKESSSNAIKWFGILVPQNLHQAQNVFKKSVEYIIESVNIDKKLSVIYDEIDKFKMMKLKLSPEE